MLRLGLLILALSALPASAHTGHEHSDGVAGFLHPLTGVDHVAAMLAVGAWSALIGGARVWAWPVAFVLAMIVGGSLGHLGFTVPFVEQSIAASLVVVGLLLALAVNAPTIVGSAIIAAFALFHGIAHGTEAAGANWLPFMAGFVVSTALLHVTGIGIARGLIGAFNAMPVRLLGLATAAAGVVLMIK